jgi:pyruvate dehydrogenase complex dehydrogenase (E1) component
MWEPESAGPMAVATSVWLQNTKYLFRCNTQNIIGASNKSEKIRKIVNKSTKIMRTWVQVLHVGLGFD